MKAPAIDLHHRNLIPPAFGLAVILALATGCKTIPLSSVQSFSTGVTSAQTQSGETFAAVNDLIAADQLEDAAHATNLTEKLFVVVLDPKSLAVWDETFAKLEAYSLHMQALISPDLTKDFVAESENLGVELQTFGKRLQEEKIVATAPEIPPGVATAFTEVGSLLIRYKAQHDALRIAAAASPSINGALQTMAESIGDTARHGIRGTVQAHWEGRLADTQEKFKIADEKMQKTIAADPTSKQSILADGLAAKKPIAEEFLTQMQTRDTQDALLAALRRSLLNLANLHSALAKGSDVDSRRFAQMIADEVKAARNIYSDFKTKLKQ